MISFLNIALFISISVFASAPAPAMADTSSTPETISEAVDYLFKLIPNKEIAIIRRTTEEEFSTNAISTLGHLMKEEWKLYSEESPLGLFFMKNEIFNPDEMSEIILICFWRRVNGQDMNIDRLFLDRMRYWDSVRTNERQ
jgi:hypothetical protein